MAKETTIVISKPHAQSTEDSVPLALIVDSFSVFYCEQGHTGKFGKASKQQLENSYGTSKDDEVVKKILETGIAQTSSSFTSKFGDTNMSRGSGDISARGAQSGR
ncbi:shwachman-bodian-diamond syndrome protein [Ceratobasidium sp. AG-Ba]|nr:shwachman-bodian-diamond syndrome protein [Ceratobasidium sp. AG-Ba]